MISCSLTFISCVGGLSAEGKGQGVCRSEMEGGGNGGGCEDYQDCGMGEQGTDKKKGDSKRGNINGVRVGN